MCRCWHTTKVPFRLWRVLDREGNRSSFNGYAWQPSDYSGLLCLCCGRVWRSKAQYVKTVPDISEAERTAWLGGYHQKLPFAADGRST